MLRAAVAMVERSGLTVSLDHIRFEDLIRDADVSRTAAYRRWPYKDLFLSDLVKELARSVTPSLASDELEMVRRIVAERVEWLATAGGRHDLLLELIRQLALLDFAAMGASPAWRTYIALHATFMSLPEGELRQEVQRTLARTEQDRIMRVAAAWSRIADLFGYRLRPELGAGYEATVTLVSATLLGLAVMAPALPAISDGRLEIGPFGSARPASWSLPALGAGSVALAFLEPDPGVHWDAERLSALHAALAQDSPQAPLSSAPRSAARPDTRACGSGTMDN